MNELVAERGAAAIGSRLATWARDRAWLAGWIVGSRLVVFGCTLLLTATRWPRGHFADGVLERPLGPLAAWDGRWYGEVAKHGYSLDPGEKSSAAFFPLYSGLLRVLHEAFGWQYLTCGLVLSNLFFAVAVVALYELGRELLPESQARRAAVYAAVFPLGFVFSMLYAESLCFAAVCLAALFAVRGRWLMVIPFAVAAALARPGGVLVALPIAASALAAWPVLARGPRVSAAAAVVAAPLGFLFLPIYQWRAIGDAFAWSHAEEAWGRSFGLVGPWHAVTRLPGGVSASPWLLRDVLLVAVYAALLVAAWRSGVSRLWVLTGALMTFLPVATGTFESAGRMGLIAPPLYWGLAALPSSTSGDRTLRLAFVALLAGGTLALGLVNP